jgi:hypothetical protein
MIRLSKFEQMKLHPMHGNLYRKLSEKEREQCRDFIRQNDHLDRDDFAEKANRWMLDQARPKRYSDMWALVFMVSNNGE